MATLRAQPTMVHRGRPAYTDLQQGLNAAVSGNRIDLSVGTYKPTTTTTQTISFQLKTGVADLRQLRSVTVPPILMRGPAINTPTILSGNLGASGFFPVSSYHVVNASGVDSTAILDGVTVTAGDAAGPGTNSSGAGLYASAGSPTINDCTFTVNTAARGGGMYLSASSAPSVTNCTFTGNSAVGGAVYIASSSPTFTACTFTNNTGSNGRRDL